MRLFYAPDIGRTPLLSVEESAHCLRVLRLGVGSELTLTDGKGHFYDARISGVTPSHRVEVELSGMRSPERSSASQFYLALAPPKSMDRTEWLVEKATEIGLGGITFVCCRFSERHTIRTDHITRVMVAAIKQSLKATLPTVEGMVGFEEFISRPFNGLKCIAHCHEGDKPLLGQLVNRGEPVLALIGPEGDFDSQEVRMAQAMGFVPVSLGASRLRTETAALAACHTVYLANQ